MWVLCLGGSARAGFYYIVLLESSGSQTDPADLAIHLCFVPYVLTKTLHTFTRNYGKSLSALFWFHSLKLVFYFSTVGYRASTSPHPVSCGGWRLWVVRPSTRTSTRRCRAPASSGPSASSPGSFSRLMRGWTSIRPPTSPDLWPLGELLYDHYHVLSIHLYIHSLSSQFIRDGDDS